MKALINVVYILLAHIDNSDIGDVAMQKLTHENIQDFINSKMYLSQSYIDKILSLIKQHLILQ